MDDDDDGVVVVLADDDDIVCDDGDWDGVGPVPDVIGNGNLNRKLIPGEKLHHVKSHSSFSFGCFPLTGNLLYGADCTHEKSACMPPMTCQHVGDCIWQCKT